MVSHQAQQPSVLLVGELGFLLEGELALQGFACASAETAGAAVDRLKSSRFPVVVVPPTLQDMGGVEFIHGVLRFFDSNVVLYGDGADTQEIEALLRTGRVAHLAQTADGRPLVEILARTVPRAPTPPAPQRFNLTPGPPAAGLFGPPGARTPGAMTGGFTAVSSAAPTFPGAPAFPSGPPAPSFPAPGSFPPGPAAVTGGFNPPGFGPPPGRAPTTGPQPGIADNAALLAERAAAQHKLEAMADELARSRAELYAAQQRMTAVESERAALLSEVEVARRSAMANVAEVMALSDEGDPITEELDQLRTSASTATSERNAARAEASALRAERDALVADAAKASATLAEARARAEAVEAQLAHTQSEGVAERDALKELAGGLSGELEHTRAELERKVRELSEITATLDGLRAERDAAVQGATAHREVEGALRAELDKTRSDVAAARTDATTARLDLQEAMMRLDETQAALDALRKEHGALRAEADPLRSWAHEVVALHASQQIELENLRAALEQAQTQGPRIADLEAQVRSLADQRDTHGSAAPVEGDTEVLLARARHLTSLVQALEPFMWGLTQATQFYTRNKVEGAEEHVRVLQQLQGVLLRLRDEIAMLDLG